jgi:3-deoxy-D-manno-octulosonic acid (KDO) 8-phosphate synthase
LSDGPNAWPLDQAEELLSVLKELDTVSKNNPI